MDAEWGIAICATLCLILFFIEEVRFRRDKNG